MAGASGPTMTFGSKKKRRSIWDAPDAAEIIEIPLGQLHPNPFNPRLVFNDEDIEQLRSSIAAEGGLLQDLSVAEATPFLEYWRERLADTEPELLPRLDEELGSVPSGDYVILIGHNRRIALERASKQTAPCKITNSKIPRARLLGLPENLRRVPLNPIEEAIAFRGASKDGLTQTEIAEQTGSKQPHISRRLKLLKLPQEVQQAIMDGLAVTEAEILLDRLSTEEHQLQAWLIMKDEGIKAAFAAARVLSAPASKPSEPKAKPTRALPQQQTQSPDETGSEKAMETGARAQTAKPHPAEPGNGEHRTEHAHTDAQTDPEATPSSDAARLRVQACRTLVEMGVPSNPRQTLRLLAPALLAVPSQSARETACQWMRSAVNPMGSNTAEPEKYFTAVAESSDARLTAHVALAIALAIAEERASDDSRHWDAQDREYLGHLQSTVNYQPTDWELDRLGGK
ncbi:ParB/RepB/Spo0J family partition protein [Streptomyces alanosinicus]|uniref:ParB-like N-terminal domain-containing protein n=1 Tax=Streptomyces alanosinicus TaxID=68171 RepID=A0A918IPW8_9ACTN|nr:ParB/RepB/Spo0J family partition protein [Streptomyces alanosinicus]GGW24638.1 hypothetical protein GCM10010339_94440 [Streptomyces alanosinicus]